MQITEQIIQRIARQVFNQMFPSSLRQSGAVISGAGSSVQYAVEAGHAANADAVPWSGVTNKPSTYPPSSHTHPWTDITNKPDTATRWPKWSEVTDKPASKTAWGQTYWTSGGVPDSISGDMSSVGDISFSASGKSIGGFLYFDTANSRIGIGTSNPQYKLHVVGTIYATASVAQFSDIRGKNVETYDWAPSLETIANAPIIIYTKKDGSDHRKYIGSVAQYWQEATPEAVTEAEDGMLSMDYGTIALVNIIALAREVRQLKAQIAQLKRH